MTQLVFIFSVVDSSLHRWTRIPLASMMLKIYISLSLRWRDAFNMMTLQVAFMVRYLKDEHVSSIKWMSYKTPTTVVKLSNVKRPYMINGILKVRVTGQADGGKYFDPIKQESQNVLWIDPPDCRFEQP